MISVVSMISEELSEIDCDFKLHLWSDELCSLSVSKTGSTSVHDKRNTTGLSKTTVLQNLFIMNSTRIPYSQTCHCGKQPSTENFGPRARVTVSPIDSMTLY